MYYRDRFGNPIDEQGHDILTDEETIYAPDGYAAGFVWLDERSGTWSAALAEDGAGDVRGFDTAEDAAEYIFATV